MAEQVSAQERLDKIVVLIAANMVAEVCSTYVLRVDNTLELYATEGLNRDAVHKTRLKKGEGLVGLIAETGSPLNLSNAPEHPSFSYRPETGEDPFHSFTSLPAHGGRIAGDGGFRAGLQRCAFRTPFWSMKTFTLTMLLGPPGHSRMIEKASVLPKSLFSWFRDFIFTSKRP